MDLNFYKDKILLHLTDHATRLLMSTVIPSKNPDVILQALLKDYVSVHGAADKCFSDDGGEFANESFSSSVKVRILQ